MSGSNFKQVVARFYSDSFYKWAVKAAVLNALLIIALLFRHMDSRTADVLLVIFTVLIEAWLAIDYRRLINGSHHSNRKEGYTVAEINQNHSNEINDNLGSNKNMAASVLLSDIIITEADTDKMKSLSESARNADTAEECTATIGTASMAELKVIYKHVGACDKASDDEPLRKMVYDELVKRYNDMPLFAIYTTIRLPLLKPEGTCRMFAFSTMDAAQTALDSYAAYEPYIEEIGLDDRESCLKELARCGYREIDIDGGIIISIFDLIGVKKEKLIKKYPNGLICAAMIRLRQIVKYGAVIDGLQGLEDLSNNKTHEIALMLSVIRLMLLKAELVLPAHRSGNRRELFVRQTIDSDGKRWCILFTDEVEAKQFSGKEMNTAHKAKNLIITLMRDMYQFDDFAGFIINPGPTGTMLSVDLLTNEIDDDARQITKLRKKAEHYKDNELVVTVAGESGTLREYEYRIALRRHEDSWIATGGIGALQGKMPPISGVPADALISPEAFVEWLQGLSGDFEMLSIDNIDVLQLSIARAIAASDQEITDLKKSIAHMLAGESRLYYIGDSFYSEYPSLLPDGSAQLFTEEERIDAALYELRQKGFNEKMVKSVEIASDAFESTFSEWQQHGIDTLRVDSSLFRIEIPMSELVESKTCGLIGDYNTELRWLLMRAEQYKRQLDELDEPNRLKLLNVGFSYHTVLANAYRLLGRSLVYVACKADDATIYKGITLYTPAAFEKAEELMIAANKTDAALISPSDSEYRIYEEEFIPFTMKANRKNPESTELSLAYTLRSDGNNCDTGAQMFYVVATFDELMDLTSEYGKIQLDFTHGGFLVEASDFPKIQLMSKFDAPVIIQIKQIGGKPIKPNDPDDNIDEDDDEDDGGNE